ncbi:hypothetical protein FQN49_006108 [Arthroderma sp. PD_2]|nr:hypothetical protein FQN49_006108 [Arthroderma sp. PD_2]
MANIPRYLRRPGDEGYRTPTIEDTEKNASASVLPFIFPSQPPTPRCPTPPVLSQFRQRPPLPHNPPKVNGDGNGTGTVTPVQGVDGQLALLTWKERIRHLTWSFFTLTMATGGLANVIYTIPVQARWLEIIGLVIFLVNLAFFVAIVVLMCLRFYLYPYTFKASFLHPTESLFAPAVIVSFGTILINVAQYGPSHAGEWLAHATVVLFWFDAALAVTLSAGIYLILWSTQTFTIAKMTPIWIFPAYPMLIIGPHAGILSASVPQRQALRIIIGGWTIQGVGFLVSLMVYSAFIYRLMTQKLPNESLRPGMFVSVGPSAFTVAGILSMGENAARSIPADFMGDGKLTAKILFVVSNFAALWLWGLAIFFFFIAVFAHWTPARRGRMAFSMTWFSFVFPNTALTTATFAVGRAFGSNGIQIVGYVFTALLFITYLFVFFMMVRAIRARQILWPQKGEDKDEGGFKIKEHKPDASGILPILIPWL